MAKGNRGGKRGTKVDVFSQEYLADVYKNRETTYNYVKEDVLFTSKLYTTETANENNFFENSVGEWTERATSPKREADYVSYNRRTGEVSSKYWYTKDGVYRESDHWGSGVASCSWYIKGENFGRTLKFYDNPKVAFIKWKDLKAKGTIKRNGRGQYELKGFKFEK